MSLLDNAFEDFTILDKITRPDGFGGVITAYTPGAKISAAAVLVSSPEATIAQALTNKEAFTITTRRNVNLQYHDVLRRDSDSKIFRVTSDGDDLKTPASASIDMRNVSAEEWTVTT